jgi:acetoin utilization protein AcuB
MMSGNYRHLPVVDGPKTVGIVSERDLLAHMPPTAKGSVANSAHGQYLARPVGEIMTSGPITVNEDASLDAALELMLVNQVGTVLVVDAGGKLSGIVTMVDVAATLLRLLRGEPELAANA